MCTTVFAYFHRNQKLQSIKQRAAIRSCVIQKKICSYQRSVPVDYIDFFFFSEDHANPLDLHSRLQVISDERISQITGLKFSSKIAVKIKRTNAIPFRSPFHAIPLQSKAACISNLQKQNQSYANIAANASPISFYHLV